MQEKQRQTQQNNKKKKNQLLLALILSMLCIFMMISYAWYYFQSHRKVNTDGIEVMPPYCLYLVEPNGTDTLQLTIGNLHPGETKQIVVGVSNKAPEDGGGSGFTISRDSTFNYELELAYTKNLPVAYKVYELTREEGNITDDSHIMVEWTDKDSMPVSYCFKKQGLTKSLSSEGISSSNNEEMYGETSNVVNLGQYDVYDKTSGASFDLVTVVDANGDIGFDLDYYMIEIQWEDGITFSDYLKETDLVYVMVKALQLDPEEP